MTDFFHLFLLPFTLIKYFFFSILSLHLLIPRDRIAVLDKLRQIVVRNFKNEALKVTSPPLAGKFRSLHVLK